MTLYLMDSTNEIGANPVRLVVLVCGGVALWYFGASSEGILQGYRLQMRDGAVDVRLRWGGRRGRGIAVVGCSGAYVLFFE